MFHEVPSPMSPNPVVVDESSVLKTMLLTEMLQSFDSTGNQRTPAPSVLYGNRIASTGLKTKLALRNCDVPRPDANSLGSPSSVSNFPAYTAKCGERNCV